MVHDISSLPKEPTNSKIEKFKTNVKPHLKKAAIVLGTAVGFIAVGVLVAKAVSPDEEDVVEDYIVIEETDSEAEPEAAPTAD